MLFPTHHLEYRCITRQKGNHSRCVLSSLWVAWITFSPTIQCPFKNSHRQSKTRNGCWNSPFKKPKLHQSLVSFDVLVLQIPPPKKKNKPDLFPEIWNLPNSRRLLLLITLSELMRVFLKRACGIYLSDQRSWTWQESRPSISFKTNWVKNTRSCLESKQSKTFRISGISKHNQQILHDEQKVSLTICIPWLSWISRPSLNNFDDTNEGAPLRSCDTR